MNESRTEPSLELSLGDARREPAAPTSPIVLLERVLQSPDLTTEKVAIAKDLMQMVREQRAEDAKAAFARAFFQLRKNMPEIYADKEAQGRDGKPVYRYCSEEEISKKLEPHLMSYGFAMLFGQSQEDGRVTAEITLMHEAGHQEIRRYTVRAGSTNAMKDATAADSGAATTAWRHLMIKLFGLKSRISANQDNRLEGENISAEQVETLRHMIEEIIADKIPFDEPAFFRFCAAPTLEAIKTERYDAIFAELQRKAGRR